MENNNIKQETSVKEPHNVFKHLYPSEPDKFLGNHLDELLVYTAEKKASDVFKHFRRGYGSELDAAL